MMALMSGAMKTCARMLGTCVPSSTSRLARLFFMLEARGPQGTVGHMTAQELTSAQMRGPEPEDTWQHRSPPQPGGEVQNHMTHGSIEAHLSREARSRARGLVATLKITSA
jgi:hypothetical protein